MMNEKGEQDAPAPMGAGLAGIEVISPKNTTGDDSASGGVTLNDGMGVMKGHMKYRGGGLVVDDEDVLNATPQLMEAEPTTPKRKKSKCCKLTSVFKKKYTVVGEDGTVTTEYRWRRLCKRWRGVGPFCDDATEFLADGWNYATNSLFVSAPANEGEDDVPPRPYYASPEALRVRKVLDGVVVGLFMTACTIVALFLDDINTIDGNRETDGPVSTTMFILFLIFAIELGLECFCRPNYAGQSMFFFLDLLALLTMVQYVPGAAVALGLPQSAISARAGRVGRIVRIVRIVRLTRIGKLAKYPQKVYRLLFPTEHVDVNNMGHAQDDLSDVVGVDSGPGTQGVRASPSTIVGDGAAGIEPSMVELVERNNEKPLPPATSTGYKSVQSTSGKSIASAGSFRRMRFEDEEEGSSSSSEDEGGDKNKRKGKDDDSESTSSSNNGGEAEEDTDEQKEQYSDTLLEEMTAISVSKIIAGIVVMLLALNYIGNTVIPYTSDIAVNSQLQPLHNFYSLIGGSSGGYNVDTVQGQMQSLQSLSLSFLDHFNEKSTTSSADASGSVTLVDDIYYFAYLNKTAALVEGSGNGTYTYEYIVLVDRTQAVVVDDLQVRRESDLLTLVLPVKSHVPLNATYSYDLVSSDSSTAGSYNDDDLLTYTSAYVTDDASGDDPEVSAFVVKLCIRPSNVAATEGSIHISIFMIGLILMWYLIYNHQAGELNQRICKPLENMMVDMKLAADLDFKAMRINGGSGVSSTEFGDQGDADEEDEEKEPEVVGEAAGGQRTPTPPGSRRNSLVKTSSIIAMENALKRAIAAVEAQDAKSLYEVRRIAQSFRSMTQGLQAFSRYVPRDIVLELLRGTGGSPELGVKPRNITIFFSDVEGFTTLCDLMAPNDVLFMLSVYFRAMNRIITSLGGTLIEFIGDAILATWNAPGEVIDHSTACVEASLQMHEYLKGLRNSKRWQSLGYPVMRIRCGIHTSNVFVGNLGAPDRMKYGIMGDGVNLASRLEELNKKYGTRLLISEDSYNHGVKGNSDTFVPGRVFTIRDNYIVRQIDCVVVKGRSKGTGLYEVLGRRMPSLGLGGFMANSVTSSATDLSTVAPQRWSSILKAKHREKFEIANSLGGAGVLNGSFYSEDPSNAGSPVSDELHSGLNSTLIRLANKHNEGMAHYFGRRWEAAITCFEEVDSIKGRVLAIEATMQEAASKSAIDIPASAANTSLAGATTSTQEKSSPSPAAHDVPAQILIKRCRAFIEKPPPDDWDGAEVMTSKQG